MKQPTNDCSTCPFYRGMSNKKKGVRIPGGFGKCTRTEGVCENPKPRPGIGGGVSNWTRKDRES